MRRQTSPQPGAQLDLFHPFPNTPQWTHLPQEVRQEAVRLLAQLLRQHRRGLFAVVQGFGEQWNSQPT
jgi:hypothetical protein